MKENKRESLAEKAENLRTAALNLYEDVRKKENDVEVLGKEWMELARGRAEKLKNFRYNIGVVGVQSSGKTTLLNTLLGYPLMPSAAVVTTCSVTYIRYGEKLAVKAEDAYGKIYNMHLEKMSRALFEDLKRYTCKCHKKYSLDHLIYFTDADMSPDGEGNPCTLAAEELSLEYGNLMHRAVLVLVLLSLYVDQNQNPELLDDTVKEIIGERKLLLEKIGIPRAVKEYKVILEWNNPVLKNGLEITDLPGLGADVAASSGYKSHESITLEELNKTDSTLLILEPEMKKEHIDPLNPILTSYEMKKIKNLEERLIPVVNKIDLCGFKNAYMNKLNQVYKKYQLEIEKTYGIAALLAEQKIFEKNPEIPLSRSAFARRNLEGVKELLEMTGASQEEYIKKMLDKNMGYSRFEEFAAYILDYLPKAEIMEALQLLIYLYQAVKTAVMMRKSRFRILSQFHRGGASAGVELVKKLDNDTKAEIAKLSATQAELMKEWRDALEIRMYKKLLPEVQKTFEEDICKEFGTMKDRIMEKRKALHANFIGDIVLSRNNGANPDTRNYPVWTGMLDTLENEKYQKTFDNLSDSVKAIFDDMVDRMEKIDEAFTTGFKASAEEFIYFCKERRVKYYKEALQGILYAAAREELSDSQNRRIAGETAKYLRENEPKSNAPKILTPEAAEILAKIETEAVLTKEERAIAEKEAEKLFGTKEMEEKQKQMTSAEALNVISAFLDEFSKVYQDTANSIDTYIRQNIQRCQDRKNDAANDVVAAQLILQKKYYVKNEKVLTDMKTQGVIMTGTTMISASNVDNILQKGLKLEDKDLKEGKAEIKKIYNEISQAFLWISSTKIRELSNIVANLTDRIGAICQYGSRGFSQNLTELNKDMEKEKEGIRSLNPEGRYYKEVQEVLQTFEKEDIAWKLRKELEQCHKELLREIEAVS